MLGLYCSKFAIFNNPQGIEVTINFPPFFIDKKMRNEKESKVLSVINIALFALFPDKA